MDLSEGEEGAKEVKTHNQVDQARTNEEHPVRKAEPLFSWKQLYVTGKVTVANGHANDEQQQLPVKSLVNGVVSQENT
jgi:hypothetical protein